ncbi:MAG: hypothetical protein FWG02_11750 [Holophagaceae bacterium]|nr:hypothetical protein [Holophagaceae bacterium]
MSQEKKGGFTDKATARDYVRNRCFRVGSAVMALAVFFEKRQKTAFLKSGLYTIHNRTKTHQAIRKQLPLK